LEAPAQELATTGALLGQMSIYETTFRDGLEGSFTVLFSDMTVCSGDNGRCTSSATVEAAGNLWSVQIFANGSGLQCRGFLSCYVMNESSNPTQVSYSVTVQDGEGAELGRFHSFGVVTFQPKGTASNKDRHGEDRVCGSNRQKRVTVCVSLTAPGSQVNRSLDTLPHILNHKKCAPNGSAGFLPLLSSGLMSDFTIVARHVWDDATSQDTDEDWVSIPVHKLILCYRSEVLMAMLKLGMSESTIGELRITDCDAAVVQDFVLYLYTGRCDPGPHAEPLLVLAHRYEMRELQCLCEHHLKADLTADNALHVLSVADLYHLPELRTAVLIYIGRNPATLLKSRKLCPELCLEVMCAMSGVNISEAQPVLPV
jgi:hypothetical protein